MYPIWFLAQSPGSGSCCEDPLQCRRSRCRWPDTCPPEAGSCTVGARPCWGGSWTTPTPCSPLIKDNDVFITLCCTSALVFVFHSFTRCFFPSFAILSFPPFFKFPHFIHSFPPHPTCLKIFFPRKTGNTRFSQESETSSPLLLLLPILK